MPELPAEVQSGLVAGLRDTRLLLAVGVLALGMWGLGLTARLLRMSRASPVSIIRGMGLMMIVTVVAYLATGGFASSDLAVAMGVFGTIAGVLGFAKQRQATKKKPTAPDTVTAPSEGGTA